MNLCTNAVQAMDDKGILRIKLEKICLDGSSGDRYWRLSDGEYVRLTLSDTGSGIEPDLLDRIFEPYFTTKPVDRGLGMGLAVVHGIVENCNGAVKIKSQVGEGTTVEILFPIIETELAPDSKPIETLPGGTERVLIVDDEASLVKLSEKILTKLGYHVVGRTNSIEALDLFKKEPNNFDLVITDMAMPQLRGDRLITELRKIRSDIPIVLCTGYSDRIDQDSAKTMGINALLNKPVEKKNLAKTVRKMLDGSAGVFEQKPTVLK
jgi:CheY-like chemotaxis protein